MTTYTQIVKLKRLQLFSMDRVAKKMYCEIIPVQLPLLCLFSIAVKINRNNYNYLNLMYSMLISFFRAFDIANHFCEWCFDYSLPEYPHFLAKPSEYPSTERQVRFFFPHKQLIIYISYFSEGKKGIFH